MTELYTEIANKVFEKMDPNLTKLIDELEENLKNYRTAIEDLYEDVYYDDGELTDNMILTDVESANYYTNELIISCMACADKLDKLQRSIEQFTV